jgi:hypothetical protein
MLCRDPTGRQRPALRRVAAGVREPASDNDPLAGLDGAAATLVAATVTPQEELRLVAERDLKDLSRFTRVSPENGGPQALTWPHPDQDEDPTGQTTGAPEARQCCAAGRDEVLCRTEADLRRAPIKPDDPHGPVNLRLRFRTSRARGPEQVQRYQARRRGN